jgi:hypothetical protein
MLNREIMRTVALPEVKGCFSASEIEAARSMQEEFN